ncbi:MAG: NAD-dependent epimerase/dehydratase family protein [Chloroflexota bacterium]|nr:NAD-dependent epimerase/dehydratase family protein [Chloroflexota bacterium]
MKEKKIIITGGLGFLGFSIFKKLINENYVLVIDNLSSNITKKKFITNNKNGSFYELNITSNSMVKIFKQYNPEIVIHCAAQTNVIESMKNPLKTKINNIDGTKNILESVKSLENCYFVFISSGGAIYGEPKYLPVDENHQKNPISNYGISKLKGEFLTKKILSQSKINYSIIRPSNIYGPGQKTENVVAKFIKLMRNKEEVKIFGDGSSSRDYIYIDDLVEIILRLCDKKIDCTINASSNQETKILEIFNFLKRQLNYDLNPTFLDDRKGEILNISLDNSNLIKILNFNNFTSIEKGLFKTINN